MNLSLFHVNDFHVFLAPRPPAYIVGGHRQTIPGFQVGAPEPKCPVVKDGVVGQTHGTEVKVPGLYVLGNVCVVV